MASRSLIMALFILLLPFVASQAVGPSSAVLPQIASPVNVTFSTSGMAGSAGVAPMTQEAGLGLLLVGLNVIKIMGNLKLFNAYSQASVLTSSDIAYISCDSNINSSNLSATEVVNLAITQKPIAILLYSLQAPHCALIGSFSFKTIYTMTSVPESINLQNITQMSLASPTAIIADAAAFSAASTPNGTSGGGQPSNSNPPSAPTTAVAMSVLYSITGIITLLFLAIIATGAVRAHRHPERYGPRAGFAGSSRQSRAKGLARAMLETLPIIKFGDPEPVKEGNREVELEEGVGEVHSASAAAEQPVEGRPVPKSSEVGAAPESGTADQSAMGNAEAGDKTLGCSICTEDFEKGEDVRVLPCNHKFHPACIDPWLLNVSGTCPLCRVNLAPVDSTTPEDAEGQDNAESDAVPPLLDAGDSSIDPENAPRDQAARTLDAALLHRASATERIAALRELRQQRHRTGNANNGNVDDQEEQSRRARLTRRLRDAFRIRTRTMTSGGGEA